jgi:lipopolysaccharide assembly outer membrane protein LptD (OstA)
VVENQKAMIRSGQYGSAFLLAAILLISSAVAAPAQQPAAAPFADTLASGRPDTVKARTDTTGAAQDTVRRASSSSGIDTTVVYSASDSIVYDLSNRTMYLHGNADIKHKDLQLRAEEINVNWTTAILNAGGVPDTADTTGKKFRGLPELVEGAETYNGFTIAYNFKTKKGKIDLGKTQIEKALYYGEAIKKVDTDVLFVADGKFTTCDLDHPHYFFASPEMKVHVKDKIIGRPIYLYISDVPVFALPFGIFPSERGRRSGLIAPAYGESDRGRYLTHMGYYWAINDYMDWSARADVYSKGSYTLYSDYRYALRYNFTGSISGSYGRSIVGEPGDPNYSDDNVFNVHLGHSQEFNPTTRLIVDFSFMSATYFQRTSNDMNDLLRQNAISNATLTKSWEGTPNSMTINVSRDQNLQPTPGTEEIRDVLPSFIFSRVQSFPFRSSKRSGSGELAWYELIGYSYNAQFTNIHTKTTLDSGAYKIDENRGLVQNVAVNLSPRVGYFTFTPQFNYTSRWYDEYIDRHLDDSGRVVTDVNKAITATRTYSLSIAASTKIYGVLQPGVFGITGIRHQVIPTLSYIYQPDFSEERFGYYGRYVDTNGVTNVYDRHEGSVIGSAPAGKQKALRFDLGNVFEMKTVSSDTSGQENKFQLLNLGLGLSYNFARDSLNFSDLSMNFRTSIGQILSFGGNATYSLYKAIQDPTGSDRRINTLLIKDEGRLGDLTNFGISISTRLSGEKKKTTKGPARADSTAAAAKSGYVNLYDQEEADFSIPWNLDLTWSFNQSQPFPWKMSRSSTVLASLGFNLTEAWKFSASASYDLVNKVFAAPQISIYRDLHCWEMNFYWVPVGQYKNFRLDIRLKAPFLQDVKVSKAVNTRGVY